MSKKVDPNKITQIHEIYQNAFLDSAKWMACIALGYELICQLTVLLVSYFCNVPTIDSGFALAGIIQAFSGIQDPFFSKFLELGEIILEFVFLFLGYEQIFDMVLAKHKRSWYRDNKHKVVKGKWLHIHDKDPVRIGLVTFVQSISSVAVDEAFNVSPNSPDVRDGGRTTWTYTTARLYPLELTGVEFIATYSSNREDGRTNTGTHIFYTVDTDIQGFPVSMKGKFCDTFELVNDNVDITTKRGKLYLYRLSAHPEIEAHIYGPNGLDEDKLRNLINDPAFENDSYVSKIKECIHRQNALRQNEAARRQAEQEEREANERNRHLVTTLSDQVDSMTAQIEDLTRKPALLRALSSVFGKK